MHIFSAGGGALGKLGGQPVKGENDPYICDVSVWWQSLVLKRHENFSIVFIIIHEG